MSMRNITTGSAQRYVDILSRLCAMEFNSALLDTTVNVASSVGVRELKKRRVASSSYRWITAPRSLKQEAYRLLAYNDEQLEYYFRRRKIQGIGNKPFTRFRHFLERMRCRILGHRLCFELEATENSSILECGCCGRKFIRKEKGDYAGTVVPFNRDAGRLLEIIRKL